MKWIHGIRLSRLFVLALAVCGFCVPPLAAARKTDATKKGKVRQYYIAADELDWDYAPSGIVPAMGR
jgi:hypothetical protein